MIQGGFYVNKKDYIKRKTRFKKHINPKLCSTCIECCCKSRGCDAIPLDVNPFTPEHIIELIDKGIYSISYTLTYDKRVIPTLRSREVDTGVFNFSDKHKACSLLSEHGCTLTEKERPSLALLLIPKMHPFHDEWRCCKQLVKTKEFIKMWRKVSGIMEEVVQHYTSGKDFETLFWDYVDENK